MSDVDPLLEAIELFKRLSPEQQQALGEARKMVADTNYQPKLPKGEEAKRPAPPAA